MFAPVILGSDKTTVSVGTGHTEFYPLYASLGNVHNNVRRAHRNAISLIAFLAIPKSRHSIFPLHRLIQTTFSGSGVQRRCNVPQVSPTTIPHITFNNPAAT